MVRTPMLDYIAIIYSGPLREYSEVTKASPRLHGSENKMRVLQFRVEGSGDYMLPIQPAENSCDCGVFLLKYVEWMFHEHVKRNSLRITQVHISSK